MVIYEKKTGSRGIRYMKRMQTGMKPFVQEDRVPPWVLQMFEETGAREVTFDDKPHLPRCIFCEGPATLQRMFSQEMLDMCADHYYSKSLGAVAAQYKLIKEKRIRDGLLTPKSPTRKQKKQPELREGKDERQDPDTDGTSGQGQRDEVE